MHPDWIVPNWPALPGVRAFLTSRNGGVSAAPYHGAQGGGMNLSLATGDDPRDVARNHARLEALLPTPPVWLRQVHGTTVIDAAQVAGTGGEPEADAAFTRRPGTVCAVRTADCLAALFCDKSASVVGAAHAGWRGLSAGILEETVAALGVPPDEVLVFLGPAIGPRAFEVGADVVQAFLASTHGAERAFRPHPERAGKWLADLPGLARIRLANIGVTAVSGGDRCTVSEPEQFYSFRREGTTGRMAGLIWIEE